MKFLCAHEEMASHFIYGGLGEALRDLGHTFGFWRPTQLPAIPVFDEYKPDVFIGQAYNLDKPLIKALNRHPEVKVVLKVGIWGSLGDIIDTAQYPVLMKSDKELEAVSQLHDPSSIIYFNYCHGKRIEDIIGHWSRTYAGKLWGFLPAANTKIYYPTTPDDSLKSDFAFIGGYWPYKAQNLNKYIIPLCHPVGKYNIKIFGNQTWPVPQYMGLITDEMVAKLLCSATICPNIHEPHSNQYGFDVVARLFNICACKGFCITDEVASITEDIFLDNEVISIGTPREFREKSAYFLAHPDERIPYMEKAYSTVMKHHTYLNRAMELCSLLTND